MPPEVVLKVIDESPLYWGLIIALGRFVGVRGSSELYRMEWGDVHWSSEGEAGWIAIRTKKNERHGRLFRQVPMAGVVEELLSRWYFQAAEGEAMVFPGMKSRQNFATMVEKLAMRAGVQVWQVPWYNLRKSFCSDLLENVMDISYYEEVTDHTYTIARKHYQIMHHGRALRGAVSMARVFDRWEQKTTNLGGKNDCKNGSGGTSGARPVEESPKNRRKTTNSGGTKRGTSCQKGAQKGACTA